MGERMRGGGGIGVISAVGEDGRRVFSATTLTL